MYASKFSRVLKSELPFVLEFDNDMLMLDAGCVARNQIKTAGHSEMQQHGILIIRLENQILPPALDRRKSTSLDPAAE